MNCFIIGTEHQYAQVLHAIEYFKIDERQVILVFENLGKENKFISHLSNERKFKHFYVFDSWIFQDVIFKYNVVNKFIGLCYLINKNYYIENLFISHYNTDSTLIFESILSPNKIFLLDEGTASFSVVLKRKNLKTFNFKLIIKSLCYRRIIKLPKSLCYFSLYNLDTNSTDSLIQYNIAPILNQPLDIRNSVIFFLGSGIIETGLLLDEQYFKYLKSIRKLYSDKHIYYFAHRSESLLELEKIKEFGFEIVVNKMPFEKLFETLQYWPLKICSFNFTGVLDNISRKWVNIPELEIFKISSSDFLKEKEVYLEIEKHLKKNKKLIFSNVLLNEKT